MKKKLLLIILLLILTISCTTLQAPTIKDIDIPVLTSVRPVKPVLTQSLSVGDILHNYNTVINYSNKQDDFIDTLIDYHDDLLDILIDYDL